MRAGRWQVELLARQAYEVAYVPTHPIIGFAFDAQRGSHAFASDRLRPFCAMPNGLAHVPAGCDVYSRSAIGGEYLRVVDTEASAGHSMTLKAFSNRIDGPAMTAARSLRQLLLGSDKPDILMCESWLMVLQDRLDALISDARPPAHSAASLTPARMRRIDEFIHARLADSLTVQALASSLQLSPGFLCRSFKAATGQTPQAYIMDCRLVRARELLATTRLPLADIALACGFTSHAHLTVRCRQRLGVVPSQLRRGVCQA